MTELLHNFGWRDLLDIAIVSFIIWHLLGILKETVAMRLLAGLVLLFAGYFFAAVAGLETCRWLLAKVIGLLPVVLAVIFHGDIRRALMAARTTQRLAGDDRDAVEELIDELATAAISLADRKIGALVVIERGMAVDSHIAVGTEIDAKVTSELITSIFLPYSPIHDGAVIIQKGKLTKAGCFLPLAQDPEISKSLGTRHRAAIGLSELVDAVVMVVSEETGGISLVTDGSLDLDLEPTALRKALRRGLEQR